jgi:hypothetical protein
MTTTPDFRALCAELLAAFEIQLEEMSIDNRLCKRARAALATPPPEPTDDELIEIARELRKTAGYLQLGCGWDSAIKAIKNASNLIEGNLFQRLAPPPEPPTDNELNALWNCCGDHDEEGDHYGNIFQFARAVLKRWGAK